MSNTDHSAPAVISIPSVRLSHGDFSIEASALHPRTLAVLLQGGFAHKRGNEVNSKLVAECKKIETERRAKFLQDNPSTSVIPDDVEAGFAVSDDEKAAIQDRLRDAMVKAMVEGTLNETAPRKAPVDPLTAEIRRLAEIDMKVLFSKMKDVNTGKPLAWPAKGKSVAFGPGPDAPHLTGEQLVDRLLAGVDKAGLFGPAGAPHEARLRKNAEKNLAALAARAKKLGETDAPSNIEDLI